MNYIPKDTNILPCDEVDEVHEPRRGEIKTLFNLSIQGSVCNEDNYKALQFLRVDLAKIKETKLWARHEKNNTQGHNGEAYASNVWKHALDEMDELREGLENTDLDNCLEEIADAINCLEILALVLTKGQPTSSESPQPD